MNCLTWEIWDEMRVENSSVLRVSKSAAEFCKVHTSSASRQHLHETMEETLVSTVLSLALPSSLQVLGAWREKVCCTPCFTASALCTGCHRTLPSLSHSCAQLHSCQKSHPLQCGCQQCLMAKMEAVSLCHNLLSLCHLSSRLCFALGIRPLPSRCLRCWKAEMGGVTAGVEPPWRVWGFCHAWLTALERYCFFFLMCHPP